MTDASRVHGDGVGTTISQGKTIDGLRSRSSSVAIDGECSATQIKSRNGTDFVRVAARVVEDQVPRIETGGSHGAGESAVIATEGGVTQTLFEDRRDTTELC